MEISHPNDKTKNVFISYIKYIILGKHLELRFSAHVSGITITLDQVRSANELCVGNHQHAYPMLQNVLQLLQCVPTKPSWHPF